MATDKSLVTLLRALQTPSNDLDGSRLLNSAATLLTLLSNPLNVTLLASHILSAPAIWRNPDGIRTSIQVLSAFNAASIQKLEQDSPISSFTPYPAKEGLSKEVWVKAVVQGADDRSLRWKHMLLLGGLLLGFENQDRHGLPLALRRTLESAIVIAGNFALQDIGEDHGLDASTIALVLSNVSDILSNTERSRLNHDLLLPTIIRAMFFTKGGLDWGYFLGTMDSDIGQTTRNKFNWSPKSSTYHQVQRMASGPLVAALGSLSKLSAYCVENVKDSNLLFSMTSDLSAFSRSLSVQWRQNKLSEIDITEEVDFLHEESITSTMPLLWQVLKSVLFAIIIVQRSLLGRVLGDGKLQAAQAPIVAVQTLFTLRNMYFISSRLGNNAFSQYVFTYLTAVDILSRYPRQAETFLREVRPKTFGKVPDHPHERCCDLFFLNTAEHFTLALSPSTNEDLLIGAAKPYLEAGNDPKLVESFEAAHSVVLAVISNPQNSELTEKYLPFYVDVLFKAFPKSLSPPQFRLAVRTLVRVTSPPFPISSTQPLLPSTLLESVYTRAKDASAKHLPTLPNQAPTGGDSPLSEQAVLILTLIDSLPNVPNNVLEEWLPLTAGSVKMIKDREMFHVCRQRFWDMLSNGEMDVSRAAICVAWWNTRGGREILLYSHPPEENGAYMSGALQGDSKLSPV